MRLFRSLVFFLFLGASASAEAIDEGDCRNGLFGVVNPSVGVGIALGKGRSYFLDDMNGCPSEARQCRKSAYLVSGNQVITGRKHGKYVCVYYPSKGGGTAGWIEASRIRQTPVRQRPAIREWIGRWSDEGNPSVRFYLRQGKLAVEGDAYWPSPNPPLSERPYGPNMGSVNEALRLKGNVADAAECKITFTLLGDFLVAADPETICDGMNANFTGVYKRERR